APLAVRRRDDARSTSLPFGVPLVDERGDALAAVLAGHGLAPPELLDVDALLEGEPDADVDGALGLADADRSRPAQLIGQRIRGLVQLVRRDDAVDQPDLAGLRRPDPPSDQDQLLGLGWAELARGELRPAA